MRAEHCHKEGQYKRGKEGIFIKIKIKIIYYLSWDKIYYFNYSTGIPEWSKGAALRAAA